MALNATRAAPWRCCYDPLAPELHPERMPRHIVMLAAVAARAVAVAPPAVAVAPRAVRIALSAVAVAPRGVRVAPRAVAVAMATAALVAIALSGCAVQVSTPVTDLEARERYPVLRIGEAPASVTTAADRIEEAWTRRWHACHSH